MKRRNLLGKTLVAAGLIILFGLLAAHWYTAAHHRIHPFDEDGEPVFIPFLGTILLGSGLFVLALSGGKEN